MSEANDIIKDFSEREFRSFGSTALFANLKWWANEENNQCNPDEYYGAAEPPVRCGESHLSGLTEPPHFVY